MSADNWAICPRCIKQARAEHDAAVARVMESYGQIPVEDFDAARAALKDVNPEDYQTFREDYEFYGAEEGHVVASYHGACGKCGLSLEFKHEEDLHP